MNNIIYNLYPSPLYISDLTSNENLVSNGDIYGATSGAVGISVGSSYLLELNNPEVSNKTIYISKILVTAASVSVGLRLFIYKNGTITSPDDTVASYNQNFASSNQSVANLYYKNSNVVTGGNLVLIKVLPLSIYSESTSSAITIPPGSSVVIRLSEFVSIGNFSMNLEWVEI